MVLTRIACSKSLTSQGSWFHRFARFEVVSGGYRGRKTTVSELMRGKGQILNGNRDLLRREHYHSQEFVDILGSGDEED